MRLLLDSLIEYADASRSTPQNRSCPSRMITTINDNGDGFPPEAALEVFQPFRRLSAKGDGQGLGLAICKRIVERHSGTIRAVSEPAGGTTITVTLRKVGEASS